jgi:hypothetical protein
MTATNPKSMLIEELIDDALGHLADWKKPISERSIGPQYPHLADEYCVDIESIKHDLRVMLAPWSEDELVKRFQKDNYNGCRVLRDPKGTSFLTVKRILALQAREPAWFISGWHVKALEIDAVYWRAFSSCTLPELTLMSVGLDPRKVNFDALFERYGHLGLQDKMLVFLEDQYEAIANGLGVDPDDERASISLSEFYTWVMQVKFKIDGRFRALLRDKFANETGAAEKISPKVAVRDSKPLHKSSYNLHAKLIYTMAVEKYGFKSLKDVGRVAKRIQHDAELLGQTPSIRPIRLLLTRGHELCTAEEAL